MRVLKIIFFICIVFSQNSVLAQEEIKDFLIVTDTVKSNKIDPLTPAKAAFYSAILPGLGQAYNKKYWKIPIVYGAIGVGIYSYSWNNDKYHQFRDAYKKRLEGLPDEFDGQYSDATLITAQRSYQKNRDLSLLITVGLYVLNIIDANVDAHLLQFNVSENLTLKPDFYPTDSNARQNNVGLCFNYKF